MLPRKKSLPARKKRSPRFAHDQLGLTATHTGMLEHTRGDQRLYVVLVKSVSWAMP